MLLRCSPVPPALAAARRGAGTAAAGARASNRTNVVASGADRPPTSIPKITRRQRRAWPSSEYVWRPLGWAAWAKGHGRSRIRTAKRDRGCFPRGGASATPPLLVPLCAVFAALSSVTCSAGSFEQACLPHQYALSTRAGAETLVRTL